MGQVSIRTPFFKIKLLNWTGPLPYLITITTDAASHFGRIPAFLKEGPPTRAGDNSGTIRMFNAFRNGHVFTIFGKRSGLMLKPDPSFSNEPFHFRLEDLPDSLLQFGEEFDRGDMRKLDVPVRTLEHLGRQGVFCFFIALPKFQGQTT